jgi:AAA ATPase domain
VLDEELGVRPGLALERLANEIRNESADLDWQQAQSGAVRVHPKVRRQDTIFGRSRELQRLQAALTAASEGRGGVAVLTGDRGVGKTALATEVANLADDLGMATVWAGHSGEARRPPSWAWTHALRGLAGQVGHHAKDRALTTVPPEWWRQATVSGAATGSETHSAFEVAQATATAVTELAGKWPAVIVLDDLHRSDRMTRDVLELLAASVHRVPLLILATWQDGGADRPVRARAFDRLLSRSDIATMTLRGIDDAGTAALIEDLCGAVPRPEFVAAVRSRTGGNPFYIRESDLRLQLASVEAVVSGQSSVKVLDDLRRSAEVDSDAAQYTTVVAMGCLEACGSGRYHEAAVLSDGLIAFYQKTRDALSGSAGFYIRALSEFMRGRLDSSLQSLETLQPTCPPWTGSASARSPRSR